MGAVPYDTEVMGMVMLAKPTVPLCPVTVKDRIVLAFDWSWVRLGLEI